MSDPATRPAAEDASDLAAWTGRRDQDAFAALVRRHTPMVAGVCRRQLGAGAQADEAAQAVFIVFARRAHRVSDAGRLGPWLHGVALRVCSEARRAAARRARHERAAAASPQDPGDGAPWSELRPHLDEAIAALSEAQRVVVVGHFLEGRTQAAMAAQLGISVDAAHQRVHDALAKLRRWFARRGQLVALAALSAGLASEAGAAEDVLATACARSALDPSSVTGAQALAGSAAGGAGAFATLGLLAAGALALGLGFAAWRSQAPSPAAPSLTEDFEGGSRLSAGWYDATSFTSTADDPAPGSKHAAEFRFPPGSETPAPGGTCRRGFVPGDAVRIAFWSRLSPGWADGGVVLPVLVMTDADGRFDAPSCTHLTCTIGTERGIPFVSLQDARNIDGDRIGHDLAATTEARAVAGGNGGDGGAYRRGDGSWTNVLRLRAADALPDPARWHRIAVELRLNRIDGGRSLNDGIVRLAVDGRIVLDRHDVLFRTARHPDMRFAQLILGPWAESSPRERALWIDDLELTSASAAAGGGMP